MKHATNTILLAAALAALPVLGCADPDAPTEDELAGETDQDGEALGKADADSTFTFFSIEQDYRKCIYPLCGGYWVSRVNRYYTQCADGSWQDRCYVAELDFAASGLSDDQAAGLKTDLGGFLVRGTVTARDFGENLGSHGVLDVTEAWRGASDNEPWGLFTKVYDNGIRCITTPCPSTSEAKINSWRSTTLDELDIDYTGVSDDEKAAIFQSMAENGLIVAGYRYWFYDGGWHNGRFATQVYTRVEGDAAEPTCVVAGCSGQLCVNAEDGDIVTTCEWREEYACYANAECAVQADGNCGWTQTAALDQCLDDARNP
jgi:hypothetical protein